MFRVLVWMLVAAYPSMCSLSSWAVPALERLAGIQSKPVLKKKGTCGHLTESVAVGGSSPFGSPQDAFGATGSSLWKSV